jgi:hypothetical protein
MQTQHTCSVCGSVERYYAKGLCKPCYNRAWFAANPDKKYVYGARWRKQQAETIKVSKAAYHAAHRTEIKAKAAAYYIAHRDERRAKAVAYHSEHREQSREWRGRWRARRTLGFVAPVSFKAIWERDRGVCQICHLPVERTEASLDHILPLSLGGTHEPRNVRLTHRACNSRRQASGAAQLRLLG